MKKLVFYIFLILALLSGSLPVTLQAAEQNITPVFLFFDARSGEASFYFSVENNSPYKVARVMQLQITSSGNRVRWAKYLSKVPKGGSYYTMKVPLQILTGGGQIVVNAALYNKDQSKVLHVSPRFMVNLSGFKAGGEDSLFGMGDASYHQVLSENIDNIIDASIPLNPAQSLTPEPGSTIYYKEVRKNVEIKPFQVTSTTPVNLGTNVSRTPVVSLRFSEELDPKSLEKIQTKNRGAQQGHPLFNLYRIGPNAMKIPVKGKVLIQRHELTFQAAENLWFESEYIADFKGEVQSLTGHKYNAPYRWKFNTQKGQSKAQPLLVMGSFPQENGKKVGLHRQVSLNFNKPLDLTWQDFKSFQVHRLVEQETEIEGSNETKKETVAELIEGTVQVKERSLIFYPASPLANGSTYQATLKKGLVGRLGHVLRRDVVWKFQTRDTPDYSGDALQIRRFFPAHREERVSPAVQIEVTFEEELSSYSVTQESIQLLLEDQPIAGEVSFKANKLIFQPKELLKTGLSYRVALSEDVKGRMGNALEQGARWYFTVRHNSDLPTGIDPGIKIRSTSHQQESHQQEEEGTFAFKVTSENPLVKLSINGHELDAKGETSYFARIPFQISGDQLDLEILATTKQGIKIKRYSLMKAPKPISTSPANMVVQFGGMQNDNITKLPVGSVYIPTNRAHLYLSPSYRGTFGDDFAMTLALQFYIDQYPDPAYGANETALTRIKIGLEFPATTWGNQKLWLIGTDLRDNNPVTSLPNNSLMQGVSVLWQVKKNYKGKAWRLIETEVSEQNVKAPANPNLDIAEDGQKINLNATFGKSYHGFLGHIGLGYGVRTSATGLGDLWRANFRTYMAYPIGSFVPSLRYRLNYTETFFPVLPATVTDKWVNSLTRLKLAWQIDKSAELALVGQVEYQTGPPLGTYQSSWSGLTYTILY